MTRCWADMFHMSAQPLPSAVLALQPPQFGTHYPLAFIVLPLQSLSVASLKLTASSRPTAPPSSSAKCLRFGHWQTLCTQNIVFTYLHFFLLMDCIDHTRHTLVVVFYVKRLHIASNERTHLRATERHLSYGITQCYLPPDRGERAA